MALCPRDTNIASVAGALQMLVNLNQTASTPNSEARVGAGYSPFLSEAEAEFRLRRLGFKPGVSPGHGVFGKKLTSQSHGPMIE